jgi:hypothetical protein
MLQYRHTKLIIFWSILLNMNKKEDFMLKTLPVIRYIRFLFLRIRLHQSLKYYGGYFLNASNKDIMHLYNVRMGKE